jgi:hypothetical protein
VGAHHADGAQHVGVVDPSVAASSVALIDHLAPQGNYRQAIIPGSVAVASRNTAASSESLDVKVTRPPV